jgi:predicted transcriptional regulator
MKVLLSIKPQFADKIFSGEKIFEFRRTIFKNQAVKKVLVYASAPVQKVIGEFEIDEIVCEDIETLWDLTGHQGGISKEYFTSYFSGKELGYAIKIKNLRKFKTAKCIRDDYNAIPPQSFAYIY